MTWPDFLVIGAQKCATSTLCDLLGRHPDVFMCDPKEPFFFSHDDVYAKGESWYRALFGAAAPGQTVGEGSTTYTQVEHYPEAAKRLHAALPDARLIFIARDPLERIRSHWMHARSRPGSVALDLGQAMRDRPDFIHHSQYERQLDVHRAYGVDDRLLVLLFEDFVADRDAVLRRCFEHIGVDPDPALPEEEVVLHRGVDGRVDTGAMRVLRRVPGFWALRRRVPTSFARPLQRLFRRPIEGKPEWDPETRAQAVEALYDDARAFLDRLGRDPAVWPWVAEEARRRAGD